MQHVIYIADNYLKIDEFLKKSNYKKILLVCDKFCDNLAIGKYLNNKNVIKFNDFSPNPDYESVVNGVKLFHENKCDMIIALGGGSAIDVAKCIKLFSNMDSSKNYLEQGIISNDIPLIAIPTTAGTGSEATRYAVIYFNGEKQSITHDSIIPNTVIFDYHVLDTLPYYQRCSTMLDALCHSLESMWSVNSNDESIKYSKKALALLLKHYKGYLDNKKDDNIGMMEAAFIAGCAINITETTAGHAMCYKLTSLYKISHGHAAALCVNKLFPFMIRNTYKCIDRRGEEYLKNIFLEISIIMNVKTPLEASKKLSNLIEELDLPKIKIEVDDLKILTNSVNPVRLKNNPVKLEKEDIKNLYKEIGENNESN